MGWISLRSSKRIAWQLSLKWMDFGFRVGFQSMLADTANPKIILTGTTALTHPQGLPFIEPGVRPMMLETETSLHRSRSPVDMNTMGTYLNTPWRMPRGIPILPPEPSRWSTPPRRLSVLGDANMTHAKNTAWVDPGATASDSLDGNLTSFITVTGTVDVNATGVYTLTYSVSDDNETNATRTVNVGMARG